MKVEGRNGMGRSLAGVAVAVLSGGVALGEECWKTKPAAEWTLQEALGIVTDSPWAKEKVVPTPLRVSRKHRPTPQEPTSGEGRSRPRPLGESSPPPPPRTGSPPIPVMEEFPKEAYLLRWESAEAVAAAFERLRELGANASAEFQSPPPRVPDDRYVVTVKTTKPRRGVAGEDAFSGMNEEELRARAELRVRRTRVPALEAERTGVGASAAVHFYFPRAVGGKPLLGEGGQEVEFRFEGMGLTLKNKFRVEPVALR
ncbi:MAG: hypothetical protein HYY26_01350 [Acidobacteria bacterium]|nr:hypothetical protein [Acidobacteriota bacterium]